MNFHLFKIPILFAAILAALVFVGAEVVAQEKKQATGETKEVQPASEQVKAQEKEVAKPILESGKQEPVNKNWVLLDLEMCDIAGKKVNLKKYEGKVVLIVNVASKCGFTGQYKPLQALHKQYNQHGFEVIAFPCNQFGKQEPEAESAISEFCKKKYGIEFDMYSKVEVKGKQQVELFKRLTQCDLEPAGKGDIRWNFEKFLIGKDGKPIARYRSNIAPDNEAIVSKLKTALGIKEEKKSEKEKTPDSKTEESAASEKDAEKKKAIEVNEDKKS